MKLGTLLLRDAVISLGQLEAALRGQVLSGGKLGTNLVDLGFIDLDTLGRYLGRLTGLPVATKERFDAAPPEIIELFDKSLAELYVAFPLGPEPQDPDVLAVAFADPTDTASVEQLAAQCSRPIAPYIAPELRIYYYLEKRLGLTRRARFLRAGKPAGPEPEKPSRSHIVEGERRRTNAPDGIEIIQAVRFEPRNRRSTDDDTDLQLTPSPVTPPATPRVELAEVFEVLEQAEHRDQIGDAFVEYAVGRFGALVVFLLRDANAVGWRVFAPNGSSRASIETLSLPLGGASCLQAAHDSRQSYRGAAPSAGRQIERRMWEALGAKQPPADMLVVPVMVRTRVVNLVYAHGLTGPVDDRHAEGLLQLCRHTSDAYLRLIQRAKSGADNS